MQPLHPDKLIALRQLGTTYGGLKLKYNIKPASANDPAPKQELGLNQDGVGTGGLIEKLAYRLHQQKQDMTSG
jgi:hypothetical protein